MARDILYAIMTEGEDGLSYDFWSMSDNPLTMSLDRLTKAALSIYSVARSKEMDDNPDIYGLFDYDGHPLESSDPISRIPYPGVVVLELPKLEKSQFAPAAKLILDQSERLTKHLNKRQNNYVPVDFDVFLSYSEHDAELADEISHDLTQQGVSCFVARESIFGGDDWSTRILHGLRSSRVGVLLLTSNARNSPWVMAEAGAMWVLGKPFIPAILGTSSNEWPEFITQSQSIDIATSVNRSQLLSVVKERLAETA